MILTIKPEGQFGRIVLKANNRFAEWTRVFVKLSAGHLTLTWTDGEGKKEQHMCPVAHVAEWQSYRG